MPKWFSSASRRSVMSMPDRTESPEARDLALLTPPSSPDLAAVAVYQDGCQLAYERGYRDGHRKGHRDGWDAALSRVDAINARFARGVVNELRRRDLEDAEMDTSAAHAWVERLTSSMEAKARRDKQDGKGGAP